MEIDVTFDFRSDTPPGKDPDSHSPTLQRYHPLLWSKPLPGGTAFTLDTSTPRTYLHHSSELGEFGLSSDTVMASYGRHPKAKEIMAEVGPASVEEFQRIGYTIGGTMVWPGYRIERKQTINVARGFNPSIADRFDLTLECIRRHYGGHSSPLGTTLARYHTFFDLFASFRGFVDFFLVNDLVSDDYTEIRFLHSFADFATPAIPRTLTSYLEYRRLSIEFIEARNHRIRSWCEAQD